MPCPEPAEVTAKDIQDQQPDGTKSLVGHKRIPQEDRRQQGEQQEQACQDIPEADAVDFLQQWI